MIKTPSSTVIGGVFWTPGATILGSTSKTLDQLIKSLFANNEQGFAYDPNDLTEDKIKWRRNLLTETEFRNGKIDASATGGTVTADNFDGLTQGTGLRIDPTANGAYVYKSATYKADTLYTFSCFIRMLDGSAPRLGVAGSGSNIDICLVARGAAVLGTLQDLGNGLYRAYVQVSGAVASSNFGVVKYAGNSAKPCIVSGYQLEEGPLTDYQTLTDFSSEFMARFPYHALYQDAAETIPVTAAGQPVGLLLDKSGRNNHAYQTTSSMRPLLAASPQRLDYDTIDDKLITNLPAQLTGCTVIRSVPGVGTQILTNQTIPATYEDNKEHCGLIVINRALTATETSQITKLFNKAAGV